MRSSGSSVHKTVIARRFILYLHENDHIHRKNKYTIQYKEAYRIFYEQFCNEIKCRISIVGIFFEVLLGEYLVKHRKANYWIFKDDMVKDVLLNQEEIKNAAEELKNTRRHLLVDQPVAFKKPAQEDEPMYTVRRCKLCEVNFKSEEEYNEHLIDEQHIFINDFHKAMRSPRKGDAMQRFAIQDGISNKNIIVRPGETKNITIVAKTRPKPYTINSIRWRRDVSEVTFGPTALPMTVLEPVAAGFSLSIRAKKSGIVYFPVIFDFQQGSRKEQLPYELIFHVHSDDLDSLHPAGNASNDPYQKKASIEEFIGEIVPGERPPPPAKSDKAFAPKIKLPPYPFTSDMQRVLNNGLKESKSYTDGQRRQLNIFNKALDVQDKSKPLNFANYTNLLDALLFIEEHQMKVDIRDYDKPNQKLLKCENPKLLRLEVAGLAERRPSLLKGDSVYVREFAHSTTMYQGCVHTVQENAVLLGFNPKFLHSVFVPNKKFYVSFDYNRYTLKVEHLAVELVKKHEISRCFFPETMARPSMTSLPDSALNMEINWINKNIVSNDEQQQAVRAILAKTSKTAPYLIFGPPGTGKTMTMVEAIMQIYKRTPRENVLICAPSNDAANEVTKRLVKVIPSSDLLRYVALSYSDHIPPDMRSYVNVSGGEFYHPDLGVMMKKKVVITTLAHASRLVTAGMEVNHFGYVFIDESGHATETETLIPIAGILSGAGGSGKINGQVVLAGDPEQLGPILHSKLAIEYGFGTSMLERLMKSCDTYKKDPTTKKYNPNVLTKLLKNYRSHPVLIKVSNDLFYESEVIPAGDNMINVALNWEYLPNMKFPMIFHSVQAIDQTEPNSPSFFNVQEIDVVMKYLSRLIGEKLSGMKIKEEHIAVISPYKKQVQKLHQACLKKGYKQLSVCSVEQIQGQERLIIIISTVRSRPEFLQFDHKFHLGFLKNPKRMNVAITRPKALLIIVGNPNVLQCDPNWRSLIQYCKDNDAVIGDSFQLSPDEDEVGQLKEQLSRLMVQGESSSEVKPNFARGNV